MRGEGQILGKPSWTNEQAGRQITRAGISWNGFGVFGQATEVTYAFRDTAGVLNPAFSDFRHIDGPLMQAVEQALLAWADLAGITFKRVADASGYSNDATMLFSDVRIANGGAASGSSPGRRDPADSAGDVWLNPRDSLDLGTPYNYFSGINTVMHEIGHALGLAHPGDYTLLERGYDYNASYYEDTRQYSIMSYWPPGVTGANWKGYASHTPMIDDIAAIQRLYGANMTTRTGDTIYGFNATADRDWFKPTSLDKRMIFAVWDAGGVDTFDFSGYADNQLIDLREGAFSNVGDLIANVSIAQGVTIENAIGGSGRDTIIGNGADNRLQGRGGNDNLDGGTGMDTAVFEGTSASYSWTRTAEGWRVVDNRPGSPDGTDTLVGVEFLKFADRTVSLMAGPAVPAVTTGIGAVLRGEQAALEADLSAKVTAGTMTEAQAIAEIVRTADQTTSVATLSYLFFTGKIPGQGGVDYLVSPTGGNPNHLNSAYYQAFNVENRYINFAVNLGKTGEGKAAFAAKFGALSLFEATREAYKAIFGAAPVDAKVHTLIDSRVDYFASYGGDGPAGIGTKAAMVGWLLAEAEKADLGVMARSNAAFLTDLADGLASKGFAIDILDPTNGYYRPDFIFGG